MTEENLRFSNLQIVHSEQRNGRWLIIRRIVREFGGDHRDYHCGYAEWPVPLVPHRDFGSGRLPEELTFSDFMPTSDGDRWFFGFCTRNDFETPETQGFEVVLTRTRLLAEVLRRLEP